MSSIWTNNHTRLFWDKECMHGVFVAELRLTGLTRAEILFVCNLPQALDFFKRIDVNDELEILYGYGPIKWYGESTIGRLKVADIQDRWIDNLMTQTAEDTEKITGQVRAVVQWSWHESINQ